MIKKSPTAFSLIEISIVLTLIAAIIAGMVKSTILVSKSRLSNAQNLTNNSLVKDMEDIVAWYETSLETSFAFDEGKDGFQIGSWNDNNPNAVSRNNAFQTTPSSRPRFYSNFFNKSIPGINFDGIDDFLLFDGSKLIGTSYTIFVVAQRKSGNDFLMFLGGGDSTNNGNLNIGYSSNNTVRQSHFGLQNDFAVASFSGNIELIHTFSFNIIDGQRYWLNGNSNINDTPDDSDSGFLSPLASYNGAAIGRYLSNYFQGDIAEIIIFSRSLPQDERKSVESYLSQKYGIAIS